MPRGELIRSEQKKRASRRPIFDFLHAPVVQLRADVLLVTLRRTGCGSSVKIVYYVEGGKVVDDYRDKLEDVDRDESSIFVVGFE